MSKRSDRQIGRSRANFSTMTVWLDSRKAGRDRRFFELWTKKEAWHRRDGVDCPKIQGGRVRPVRLRSCWCLHIDE
jgi:hypothetical protein